MSKNFDPIVNTAACVYALLSSMARHYPRVRYISAERAKTLLQFEAEYFSDDEIATCFSNLQSRELGATVLNRWGKLGFVWHKAPCIAFEEIKKEMCGLEPVPMYSMVSDEPTLSNCDFEDPMQVHHYLLRPDCVIKLELPIYLDEEDIGRIDLYLKSVFTEPSRNSISWWPFSTTRRDNEENEDIEEDDDDDDDEFDDDEFEFEDEDEDEDEDAQVEGETE